MTDTVDRDWIHALLQRNRYLVLSTTDGERPWIAPLEYLLDDDLNFYFLSPADVRHVRHLQHNPRVAVAVFDSQQPDYDPDASLTIHGVQIEATARRLDEGEYPDAVVAAIEALDPPIPPYAVFRIEPQRFFVPKIEDGENVRVEVAMH